MLALPFPIQVCSFSTGPIAHSTPNTLTSWAPRPSSPSSLPCMQKRSVPGCGSQDTSTQHSLAVCPLPAHLDCPQGHLFSAYCSACHSSVLRAGECFLCPQALLSLQVISFPACFTSFGPSTFKPPAQPSHSCIPMSCALLVGSTG